MSICNDGAFLKVIDSGVARALADTEPSKEFLRTVFNLRLIARQIVKRDGFPDGTRLSFGFVVNDDGVGEVEFTITRKGIEEPHQLAFYLGDRLYKEPECFDILVKEMQNLAIGLREMQHRCN